MVLKTRRSRRGAIAAAGAVAALAVTGSAAAFQPLPSGDQVNNDLAAGINPALSVAAEDPANADVVGGALGAGKPAVPWSIFQQTEGAGKADQIFSRSFAGGQWTTRGNGTVGGLSSGPNQPFPGSLNFDQGQDGEVPSIDFAGAGRTVPWATWYEMSRDFGANNIFASRFDNTGDANQGKWIFGGQSRGTSATGNVPIPSLNIHPDQPAVNPSVAGGSAVDPTKPGPWVTWQEKSPQTLTQQIFVERPIGPAAPNCDGVKPAGVPDASGHVPAIGGFCFQQVGVPRVGPTSDPSLNVDPTRDGVEPDIAFTGASDGVPWVVWYEQNNTKTTGANKLADNELVFAAKGVSDGVGANGGFHWQVVGSGLSGTLDTTGANGFGTCGANLANEQQCSLNANPLADAEDPRVAAGTLNPANPTVPWVVWDETVGGGLHQVFVGRLVGTGAAAHFALVNNGQPISIAGHDATRADITFSGNTPYVTFHENLGNGPRVLVGHFVNPADPTFTLDSSDVPTANVDVRAPISSGCTANPFNADGASCQGGAAGTPFFLDSNSNGSGPLGLFANAYQPDTPVTGGASAISTSTATVSGSVNPEGAAVKASFQFGTTTAYGQSTATQLIAPGNAPAPFSAALTGLPAGTVIHYRAVATSDFGTFVGEDRTLTTVASPAPGPAPGPNPHPQPGPGNGHGSADGTVTVGPARVTGGAATVRVACAGTTGAQCRVTLTLSAFELLHGHRVVAVTATGSAHRRHRTVILGTTRATLAAGRSGAETVTLSGAGRRLLAARHRLTAELSVTQTLASGRVVTVNGQAVTFTSAKRGHGHRAR
jgi:hypothetical protein